MGNPRWRLKRAKAEVTRVTGPCKILSLLSEPSLFRINEFLFETMKCFRSSVELNLRLFNKFHVLVS